MAKDFLSALNQLLVARDSGVDSKQLAEKILAKFDGVDGLSREVKLEYDATGQGTTAKSRLLIAILQLINNVSAANPNLDPEKEMSTAELADTLRSVAATVGEDEDT